MQRQQKQAREDGFAEVLTEGWSIHIHVTLFVFGCLGTKLCISPIIRHYFDPAYHIID